MAQPTAVSPSSPPEGPSLARSNSRASTASTGTSLKRRSRTRTRTLTVSRQRGKSVSRADGGKGAGAEGASRPGHLDGTPPLPAPVFCDEPEEMEMVGSEHAETSMLPGDPPPVARTGRVARQPVPIKQEAAKMSAAGRGRALSSAAPREPPHPALARDTRSERGPARNRLRGMSLPRQAFRNNGSADSSAQPSPLTPAEAFHTVPAIQVAEGERPNPRDSILTQVSATSSSVYPASTSSGSCADSSVFPHSIDGHRDDESFSPEIVSPCGSDFDPDDVSYRLRLLVNNNYFLPPAHNKPSPLALAPQNNKRQSTKPPNSSFLDFFRKGRSKSKPTTPDAASPPPIDLLPGPILRTTSDSTTASGYVSRPHAQSSPPIPGHTHAHPPAATRVVVLREKMDDLYTAAMQVEKEIKARSHPPRDEKSLDDVIDPTDVVDLPPSSGYPFAVQASAVYGLNVQDPVEAAFLAEQLPPPTSPGIWSTSTEEDSWRKALLHEAVSLSLNNTPDPSFITDPLSVPNSPTSLRKPVMLEQSPGSHTVLKVKHHISRPILDEANVRSEMAELDGQLTPIGNRPPLTGRSLTQPALSPTDSRPPWSPYGQPPVRAETPHQTLPLSPAPRRSLINPVFSVSQPDLTEGCSKEHGSAGPSEQDSRVSLQIVRKAVSSPGLSASREADHPRSLLSITPPPIRPRRSRGASPIPPDSRAPTSFSSYRSAMSESRCSDDQLSFVTPFDTDAEQRVPRPSVTISVISEGRPSFEEYSHPSPTASAFQDAVFGSCRPPSVLSRRSYVPETSPPSRGPSPLPSTAPPRHLTMSPPPRPSSSLSPTVLPPPPRAPAIKPIYRPSTSSRGSSDHVPAIATSIHRGSSMDVSSSPPLPGSPVSLAARRRAPSSSLSLRIPTEIIPPAIHSAPAPAPPTDFFDQLQSHPNAMDDLDTSDESSAEDDAPDDAPALADPPRPAASLHASPPASLMRLGNHSTPQFSSPPRTSDDAPPLVVDASDRKKPIGNTPSRPPPGTYFASKKKGLKGISPVPSTEALPPPGLFPESHDLGPSVPKSAPRRRPATANDAEERGKRWQRESIQKFDGMLQQHIVAERDRIKRITSHISSSTNKHSS
ncbi:hypothetical protein OBBRIDRAFT_823547 [Obba rivulosa]|uniref:Uncharacterized protein n=1 Tax=Obba rivulosa TaxID=1052685 RepID=A0A8E2DRR5_9APHY|nr:hypothetical protein OBBRIDRAFT_823547 [Obba rivulosa]